MIVSTVIENTNIYGGSFDNENVPVNRTIVSKPYNFNLYRGIWNGNEWVEGATLEEIELKENESVINGIKEKYEFHKSNGWDAYNTFRAKVVNDIYKGLITEPEAFYIEENLSVAFDQISATGDWKTARYKLLQVTPYPPFVQPYYDMAMQIINDYITNNYED